MQSAGVGSLFGIQGDFEITMHFEILEDPDPGDAWRTHLITQALSSQALVPSGTGAPVWPQAIVALKVATLPFPPPADVGKAGTRLSLAVNLDTPLLGTPNEEVAYFSRSLAAEGFLTWVRSRHAPKPLQTTFPTLATTGRLRLVRSGDELFFLVSAGADQPFQLLQKYRFGAEDVQKIMICGTTGGEKAHIDLRVTDLLIRADALLGAPLPADAIPGAPGEGGPGWLFAGLLLALTVGAILALGALLRRRGGAAGQTPNEASQLEGTRGHA
jgi:hypothetical protein